MSHRAPFDRRGEPPIWIRYIRVLAGAVMLVCAQAAVAPSASAQFYFFDKLFAPKVARHAPPPRPSRQVRRAEPAPVRVARHAPVAVAVKTTPVKEADVVGEAAPIREAVKAPAIATLAAKASEVAPDRPLVAVISIEDQHVSVYGSNGLIERSDVSTGMEGHPTPMGVFAVIQKERWHESNLYSGAPMPFMQRVTWSGVAMHQGQLPGYPASHGCIRLGGEFAERWFHMTKVGLRVIIAPSDIEPQPLSHPDLPVPRWWTAPADLSSINRKPVQAAALSDEQLTEIAAPRSIELNPVAYAVAEKLKAKAELKDSEQAEGQAGDALAAATQDLKEATKVERQAARQLAGAEERLGRFGLIGNRAPPSPRTSFSDNLMAAIEDHEKARSEAGAAQRAFANAQAAVDAATEADKRADEHTEALKARIAEMTRRQETVSIFVSRKDGRLYVRQGLKPVFDVPVTIRNSGDALGTHVYVAGLPAPGETTLRWTAYTMPIERLARPLPAQNRGENGEDDRPSIGTAIETTTAAGALSRIAMTGEVKDRISELIWAGASMIISDHGLSPETGLGTDFVVETKY